ncbi:hypothetical protein JCM10908_003537 [Rhodotorula pacifica]|uniref:cytochrome b-c1 complex subunit 10 n=1 Tax=Rhodotorula pacifica TaxID=1495444 RepID=UPI003181ED81
MVQPRVQVLKPGVAPMGISANLLGRLAPSLALWGVAGAGALFVFGSALPLFQTDVLKKIPVVADYYVDKTPDSDKVRTQPYSAVLDLRERSIVY